MKYTMKHHLVEAAASDHDLAVDAFELLERDLFQESCSEVAHKEHLEWVQKVKAMLAEKSVAAEAAEKALVVVVVSAPGLLAAEKELVALLLLNQAVVPIPAPQTQRTADTCLLCTYCIS